MRLIKTLLVVLLVLAVFFVGIMFTIHNSTEVMIDLVFIQLPSANLALSLIITFAAGTLIGLLLSSLIIFALKTRLGSAKRKINNTQKEIDQLRVSSLKDAV